MMTVNSYGIIFSVSYVIHGVPKVFEQLYLQLSSSGTISIAVKREPNNVKRLSYKLFQELFESATFSENC